MGLASILDSSNNLVGATVSGGVTNSLESGPLGKTAGGEVGGKVIVISNSGAAPTSAQLPTSLGAGGALKTVEVQYAGVPSNFTPATADDTVFTLAPGERGFIQNLDDAALAVKLGATATSSSFNFVLAAGATTDDGRGGYNPLNGYVGVVSVAAMSGTARYIAWKQAAS